ncbi:MAG: glycosyltransferase family 9 protein [Ignavibacteria bacterium]|nr:glycosyltransferase family 9 protein [Ignavibacteria bacterium]MCC7158561.1 glycosyltransferase family 9 protein [Ignavibacteria bacterium]
MNSLPQKILVIRLHAIGDAALTLPACCSLREVHPNAQIDYLSSVNARGLISAFSMFDHLYVLEQGFDPGEGKYDSASKKLARLTSASRMGIELRKNNYNVVIDLQNSKYSRIVRKLTGTERYSELERYESKAHSLRVIDAFHRAGFEKIENEFSLKIFENFSVNGKELLTDSGWDGKKKIVLLNPAGAYETRMWGDENYSSLGGLLVNEGYMLLLLGTEKLKHSAEALAAYHKENIIDLAGKTSLAEVPGILSHVSGIVSDDSGLYHIAWAMGKPGVLLLGATRSDWACQPGDHGVCLNSGDLECGNCMMEKCKWGDVRCLKRYTPEMVYELLGKVME